jgi:hypothetical protein
VMPPKSRLASSPLSKYECVARMARSGHGTMTPKDARQSDITPRNDGAVGGNVRERRPSTPMGSRGSVSGVASPFTWLP